MAQTNGDRQDYGRQQDTQLKTLVDVPGLGLPADLLEAEKMMNRSLVRVIECGRFMTLLILAASAIGMVLSSQMEQYESAPRFLDLAYVLAYFLGLIGTGFWVLTCLGIYDSVKAFRSAGLNVSWLWVTVSILGTPVFAMFTVWIFVIKQKHPLGHVRHGFPALQTTDKSDKMRC